MKRLKNIFSDDNAEIMLESTIVMIITLFVLIAMISVGFLFYQQAMINTVASDVAVEIASNYKMTDSDIGSESSSYKKIKLYRTSFAVTGMINLHKARAEKYRPERVKLTSLGIYDKEPWVDDFDICIDNVGRLHVEVTVKMECSILFDGALKYFGIIDSMPAFSATGRAECLDVTAYASHVQFLEYISNKISESGGNISSILDNIIKIVNNVKDIGDLFKD